MISLHHDSPSVIPTFNLPISQPSHLAEPEVKGEWPEFDPSLADEAWLTAYNAAYAGHPGRLPSGPTATAEIRLRFTRGTLAGKEDRERDAAYELGQAMGLENENSVPPAGLAAHEADAYRKGFLAGLAEREDRFDAMFGEEEEVADSEKMEVLGNAAFPRRNDWD